MDARTTPPTRDVALFLGSAGGVSGKGSGASPSQDAVNLVRWSLARGLLDPGRDRLVAVHATQLNPLATSATLVTHELVTPTEFPEWMPPALAHAFGRFATRGGGRGAAAALLESPLAPAEALARFVSGALRGEAEGKVSPKLRDARERTNEGSSFPVADLWPAEDVVPSRRRRGDGDVPAFDLVLVGASDKNGFGFGFEALRRAVLGSVSRRVLELSPTPVLVARARDASRASGFGNDAAFAPAMRENARDHAGSRARPEKGHARTSSFPGNWRVLVDEEIEAERAEARSELGRPERHERDGATDAIETSNAPETRVAETSVAATTVARSRRASSPSLTESRALPLRVAPVTGNVICVAHDGGEDGVALVRWTLRVVLRASDRAFVAVHVAPGTDSPAALAAALEPALRSPVSAALLQSDQDVARAVAAFREERPPPATAPASSVLVVDAGTRASRGFGKNERARREGLGPFLPLGSASARTRGSDEKWGLGALLRAASERSADVLVVGSRRLERRRAAGGAARTCARLAPCAVLAVPADALGPFRRPDRTSG